MHYVCNPVAPFHTFPSHVTVALYLVCVVKLVIHKSCDDAGLPNGLIAKEYLR